MFFLFFLSNDSFVSGKSRIYKRTFNHDTIFSKGNYNIIDSTIFLGKVSFNNLNQGQYNQYLIWQADSFAKAVSFAGVKFFNGPDFSNSIFSDRVSFWKCFVNFFHMNFSFVNFSHFACFREMILYGDNADMVFDNAILPDTIDFSYNPRIRFDVNLTTANTSRHIGSRIHYIFLFNSDVSKFHIDYENFRLLFIDPITKDTLSNDQRGFLYEALLKNFKDRGQSNDYKMLDIEYHRFQWSTKPLYIRWFGNVIEFLDDYGYENERIIPWIIKLLLTFTIINFLFLNKLVKDIYTLDDIEVIFKPKSFNEYLLNLWYSLVYTSIIFFFPAIKLEKLKYANVLGTIYIVFVYLIGLILVGFAIHTVFA